MAMSSSSEEGTAPREFQLSSSQDSGSKYSSNRKKCPLCSSYRKKFYCKECINIGDFGNFESCYASKQLRLAKLREDSQVIQEKCRQLVDNNQREDLLASGIRQSRNNIRLLKLALEEKRERQKANEKHLQQLIVDNQKVHERLPKYLGLVDREEYNAETQLKRSMKARADLHAVQEEVKKLTKIRIRELMQYIFPITQIQPKSSALESSKNDTVSALADAAHMTYIKGRWVYTDNSTELQHSIVAPTLPSSGNYSDYSIWVTQNKDGVPGVSTSSSIKFNPAYSISAALTYTAQLLNVIAFYLDVRIPYKMIYSDFCSKTMTDQQFTRRVARLNANVLHLCFTQNTDLTLLQPAETLHNILQLVDVDNPDLGRRGPMEVDVNMSMSLEEQLVGDLQTSEDSDSEEGDALPNEWEAVPHVQCPEASAGPMTQYHLQSTTQNISSQQANSMAGGLMNSAAASIASMWRGWTGR